MIKFPKSKIKLLCVGTDNFRTSHLPNELGIEPDLIPFNRTTQMVGEIPLNDVMMSHANQVDAIIAMPQPNVDDFCALPWIAEISKKKPIGFIWYDYNVYYNVVHKLKNCFHIILDTQEFDKHDMMSIWTPIEGTTKSPREEREINISFFGSVDCQQRTEGLGFVINEGIPIFIAGNNDWNRVDYSMLGHYMRSSKIILNFANNRFHPDTHRQGLKGRVLEAMISGAMVLENKNSHTAKYFKDDKDIVFYENKNDMCDKIRYYLKNNEERIRIATNGQELCLAKYTVDNWWRMVIPRLMRFQSIIF